MIPMLAAPPEPLSQASGFTETGDSDFLGTGLISRSVNCPGEVVVLLAIVGVAGVALIMGLTLRAPALIVATLVVIVVSIAVGSFLDLSVQTTIRSTLYLVIVTQIAYLVGLAFAVLRRRPGRGR
ncbi:putative membrane channel-forming protein YqfA (hemolysin III family) [Mesorhizobium robiniae]|uniref:Membrane channel-forming protein YqfA (Hemolysin III family) n=1 Tax=Mesorhizobium robiniae TaxID=559315 RepID=A0ABV2GQ95_9HYPH